MLGSVSFVFGHSMSDRGLALLCLLNPEYSAARGFLWMLRDQAAKQA
jgi:hypothetical protein